MMTRQPYRDRGPSRLIDTINGAIRWLGDDAVRAFALQVAHDGLRWTSFAELAKSNGVDPQALSCALRVVEARQQAGYDPYTQNQLEIALEAHKKASVAQTSK